MCVCQQVRHNRVRKVLSGSAAECAHVAWLTIVQGLVFGQKKVVGSIVGGRSDMANMFEFAAQHGIKPMIEVLPSSKVRDTHTHTHTHTDR